MAELESEVLEGQVDSPAELDSELDAVPELLADVQPEENLEAELSAPVDINVEIMPETVINVEINGAGPRGKEGPEGPPGQDGNDGADGVSPTVDVTPITGGHQVAITDAQGTETFNVMDGADGQDGEGVPAGGDADDVLAKLSNADNDTAWKSLKTLLLNLEHPVGSLYWSSVSTDPSTLFGGTWARVKDTFILAAGDNYSAGATGGEATHKLTAAESGLKAHGHGHSLKLPTHVHTNTHKHPAPKGGPSNNSALQSGTGSYNSGGSGYGPWFGGGYSSTAIAMQNYTGNTGNNSTSPSISGSVTDASGESATNAHNNMPPYKVYYCWERTA